MKILLAVDGSEFSRRMLDYIAGHPDIFGEAPQYTVFTAVPALPVRAKALSGHDAVRTYYEEEAAEVLGPLRALCAAKGIEAVYAHAAGEPPSVIATAAREGGYDMVVMGSHGHNPLKNLVLGSVVSKVLAGCEVPVLILR